MSGYKNVDKNLIVETNIGESDVVFYDVRNAPFSVYGLYNYQEGSKFKRIPTEIAQATNSGVAHLYSHTAGARVRFSTDSQYVAIKAEMPVIGRMSHFALTGSSGFDLYIDDVNTGNSSYWRSFIPDYSMTDGYTSQIKFATRKKRYITIHFPTYSDVSRLLIGVQQDAMISKGLSYRDMPPIVYYGSSITQGGCASRPGNIYSNIITRTLNIDHINLGFSGNGKGEDAIVDYMASLTMSAFVSDYDHNAPSVAHLANTHLNMYQKIRAFHPDIPYIMISRPDMDSCNQNELADRRKVILDTYHYACAQGDSNVWFIDGSSIFRGPYEELCTVDGVHPNDMGFAMMADAIGSVLKRAFSKYWDNL